MSKDRPAIPDPMQRALRQEAYLGCVFCGNPIIEYHHIVQYHIVKCHEQSNLVVLCTDHHHRANCGEIIKKRVIEAKNNPYNKNIDFVGKEIFFQEYDKVKIRAGNTVFENFSNFGDSSILIQIENKTLLSISKDDKGYALINAEFYDKNNNLVASIKNSEWKAYKGAKLWDIEYSPGHLIIRSQSGIRFLEFRLIGGYIELKVDMHYNNKCVSFKPKGLSVGNMKFTDCKFESNGINIRIN